MKRVTATEAERGGTRLVLHREAQQEDARRRAPTYDGLIWATKSEEADRWGGEWKEPGEALSPVDRDR